MTMDLENKRYVVSEISVAEPRKVRRVPCEDLDEVSKKIGEIRLYNVLFDITTLVLVIDREEKKRYGVTILPNCKTSRINIIEGPEDEKIEVLDIRELFPDMEVTYE